MVRKIGPRTPFLFPTQEWCAWELFEIVLKGRNPHRSTIIIKVPFVSIIREKYHNYILYTNPLQLQKIDSHKTPRRQLKQSNQLSLSCQDDCITSMATQ